MNRSTEIKIPTEQKRDYHNKSTEGILGNKMWFERYETKQRNSDRKAWETGSVKMVGRHKESGLWGRYMEHNGGGGGGSLLPHSTRGIISDGHSGKRK